MLQSILFSFYLALGAGVFSAIEGWSFTDGLYWADYTVLTIGLGTDFPLTTTLGRMLLIPYAPFGIIMVGLLVRSVMGLVMERAKEKVVMRRLGKERDRWTDSINKRLQDTEDEKTELIEPGPRSILFCWHYRRHKKFRQLPRIIAHVRSAQHQDQLQHHNGKWHQAEFELMRYIEFMSEQSERYVALMASILAFLILWVGGSLVFWATEYVSQTAAFRLCAAPKENDMCIY
jgi:potassium channel subfamily K